MLRTACLAHREAVAQQPGGELALVVGTWGLILNTRLAPHLLCLMETGFVALGVRAL